MNKFTNSSYSRFPTSSWVALFAFSLGSACSSSPRAPVPVAEAGQLSFQGLTVPRDELHAGGPPKDGIPAITGPHVIAAGRASFLHPDGRVVGLELSGQARAWPLSILNYHEVINDRLGEIPIAVTYCPLCDSAAVFDRRTPKGVHEFGVSGLLYNSNVLLYDRSAADQSLWSQLMGRGVSGPHVEQRLVMLPVELTTWQEWRARYPHTTVMSLRTGHQRDYSRNPYKGYFQSDQLMFPARPISDRLPAKQAILGLTSGDASVAVPTSIVGDEPQEFEIVVGEKSVRLVTIPVAKSLRVMEADEGVQWMYSFWFGWYAFHPQTEIQPTLADRSTQ